MLRWTHLLVGTTLVVFACKSKEDDVERRGKIPEIGTIYGVPNLDDDDNSGSRDWKDAGVEGENDLAPVDVTELQAALFDDDKIAFSWAEPGDVRIWNGDEILLDQDISKAAIEARDLAAGISIEFGDYAISNTLQIDIVSADDSMLESLEVKAYAAPAILNHHLQPYERAFAVKDSTNDAMISDMKAVMGDTFITRPAVNYGFDVWVQDEFELATVTSPTSRIDLVIDSIRTGGNQFLDAFPEEVVAKGADHMVDTWGSGYPSSQDSFGNLEVSPPVTVDGVEYPFGRIYYGRWDYDLTIHNRLTKFMEKQKVQAPIELDVSWLCVGHVDEFTTFLPDPSAPKGFRLYVADVDAGYAFLEGLAADTPIPKYRSHGFSSVSEILDDPALRALNEDYQRDYIEPDIDILKAELGLDEGDVVRVPGLFEEVGACGPYGLALIPATVNMLVSTNSDGSVEAFIPDPFLRDTDAPQSEDPFITAVNDLLPSGVTPHWVDDWNAYHLLWGEVHCGTNTVRTPTANWWEDAMHLLEEGE